MVCANFYWNTNESHKLVHKIVFEHVNTTTKNLRASFIGKLSTFFRGIANAVRDGIGGNPEPYEESSSLVLRKPAGLGGTKEPEGCLSERMSLFQIRENIFFRSLTRKRWVVWVCSSRMTGRPKKLVYSADCFE